MEDMQKSQRRAHLSKTIAEKLDIIGKLRNDLEKRKKVAGSSVDEQIVIAEMEYRLVKEEMTLLSLQEQHWESAALWDAPPQTPDIIQKEVCEVLYSYIVSVKEKGGVPALHVSEHLSPENSILISSQGDRPSIPRVEWAHHSTELQVGDRLVEVNGRLVIGKDPCEVNHILSSSRSVCRIVFLRPLSPYQLMKNNGCKETSNLRHELTSVVSRLNQKMVENSKLMEQNLKLQKDGDDLKTQNRQLKLQIVSLQSILLYLFQVLEKNNCEPKWDNLNLSLLQNPPTAFDILKKTSTSEDEKSDPLTVCALPRVLSMKKRSIEPSPCVEQKKIQNDSQPLDFVTSGGGENS